MSPKLRALVIMYDPLRGRGPLGCFGNYMEDNMRKIAVALLLSTMAFWPVVAAAEDVSIEELAVGMADTSEDHAALAKYFRAQAATARQQAAGHEGMAKRYGMHAKLVQKGMMQQHCKKIAGNEASTADEFEALAKLHEEAAKSSK